MSATFPEDQCPSQGAGTEGQPNIASQVSSTAQAAKEQVSAAAQAAKEQATAAAQAAKEQVTAAAEPVANKARTLAEEQKQGGADRIDEVVRAVHTAADEIGKQVPQAAGYIHSGAEQLQRASKLLRENSVDDLLKMTNKLAHDRPMAFIGGSVAAGFVLARFLRTSAPSGGRSSAQEQRP